MATQTNRTPANQGRRHARPAQQTGPALSIAAAVLGVLAVIVGIWVQWQLMLAIVLAACAIIVGIAALVRHARQRALAIVGIILGALIIAVYLIVVAIFVSQIASMSQLFQ